MKTNMSEIMRNGTSHVSLGSYCLFAKNVSGFEKFCLAKGFWDLICSLFYEVFFCF